MQTANCKVHLGGCFNHDFTPDGCALARQDEWELRKAEATIQREARKAGAASVPQASACTFLHALVAFCFLPQSRLDMPVSHRDGKEVAKTKRGAQGERPQSKKPRPAASFV